MNTIRRKNKLDKLIKLKPLDRKLIVSALTPDPFLGYLCVRPHRGCCVTHGAATKRKDNHIFENYPKRNHKTSCE